MADGPAPGSQEWIDKHMAVARDLAIKSANSVLLEANDRPPLVVVCGSRYRKASEALRAAARAAVFAYVASLPSDAVVVDGGAPGVDSWAHEAAVGCDLAWTRVRAEWRKDGVYDPRAGFERNRRMLDLAPDLVHAVWDGKSGGTADTVAEARRRGIPVEVEVVA